MKTAQGEMKVKKSHDRRILWLIHRTMAAAAAMLRCGWLFLLSIEAVFYLTEHVGYWVYITFFI